MAWKKILNIETIKNTGIFMNKSLILSSFLLLAFNINSEKGIEQALLDSDFNAISKNAELQLGISQSRKKHYLKIAQNMAKTREADTKSWVPHKWSVFLNACGILTYEVCISSMRTIKASEQLRIEGVDDSVLKLIENLKENSVVLKNTSAILAAICFYRAYNYKQGFYRNAVAIKSIIENAPVIESAK